MENLDIIVLTTILSTLFVVFGIVVFKELRNIDVESVSEDKSPRANLVRFMGSLFDDGTTKDMTPVSVAKMYRAVKRTISDMESDGVYFPEEVKEKLEKKREEMTCEYSGLRSVMSYLEEDYHEGHS